MYAAPPHHTISAYGYPQGMVPLNSSTTYSTRPNLPAMQQQQQQQLYHHQPFYMMPSSSSFGVVSGAHPMVGYATQGPITYVLVPAADFNFQGVPSTVAASEVRRGGAVVDAALQPSTPFAASTFPSPSSPSNAASLSSGAVNASVLSPSQRFASSASVPLPVNNVAVSPASSLTPPSSLTSTSAHEDIGVDRVTIRTLERLMDDDEIAAALQRTNPRLPPSAPAMVEAVVEPSLSKASTGSQRSDEDAVPLPEEPTNSTTGRKKLQSSYAKAAVQSANGNNKSKDTAKKPSTNGQPTTASTALKFSSSRQKKGNRVTQIPPPAPGDTEKGPRQLIVNYLAPEVDSAGLEHLFAPYGDIEVARIVTDTATGLSRGYGFVYYRHHADAETAIDEASGRVLLGRRIRVSYAVPQRAVSSMVDGAK